MRFKKFTTLPFDLVYKVKFANLTLLVFEIIEGYYRWILLSDRMLLSFNVQLFVVFVMRCKSGIIGRFFMNNPDCFDPEFQGPILLVLVQPMFMISKNKRTTENKITFNSWDHATKFQLQKISKKISERKLSRKLKPNVNYYGTLIIRTK